MRSLSAERAGPDAKIGGPRTIGAFRSLGALGKLGLIVLPLMLDCGMRLTPSLSTDAGPTLESHAALPTGAVELVYDVAR